MLFQQFNNLLKNRNHAMNERLDWDYWNAFSFTDLSHCFQSPIQTIERIYQYGHKGNLVLDKKPELIEFRAGHSLSEYFLGVLMIRKIAEVLPEVNDSDINDLYYLWVLLSLYHDYGYHAERNTKDTEEFKRIYTDIYKLNDDVTIRENEFQIQFRYILNHYGVKYTPYQFISDLDNVSILPDSSYRDLLIGFSKMFPDVSKSGRLRLNYGLFNTWIPTFNEADIARYFAYRLTDLDGSGKNCHIDHGIIGGYLLFDRIIKEYIKAIDSPDVWEINKEKLIAYRLDETQDHGFSIRKFSLDLIAKYITVADAIMVHNIWVSDKATEEYYRDFNLDSFLEYCYPKISFDNNPLLFILAICDVIEPYKRLSKHYEKQEYHSDEIKSILKEIDIAFDDRRISIKSESNILDIESYFKSFQSLASWVKCTPHGINASEYEITYNKT